jgi:plastocyanin
MVPTRRRFTVKKWLAPILACLVLGIVAVGCGDDDSSDDDAATTEQQATTEQGSGGASGDAQAQKDVSVDVVDIDYDPREVTVAKGGTITWTNTGDLPHTVTKDGGPGPDFSSDTLNNGDTYEETFDTVGTIDYVCKIHPQQQGTITVK